MRMSDADVLHLEQELENIIGAEAGQKADTATTALNVISDLARAGGGVASQVSQQQKQKAAEAAAKKAGTALAAQQQPQPQAGQNPFLVRKAGLPVYGWVLIGVGSVAAIGIAASMLRKK